MNEESHRETTKTLRETEEHYAAIIENVADAIVINVGTERVFVNKAFLKLLGVDDASQVLGTPLDQFIVPEDRQLVSERTLARQRGHPVPGIYEYRIRRADGEVRTVQTSSVPTTYKGTSAALAVLRDVTERKRAEEALRNSEERYCSLYTKTPAMLHSIDRRYRIVEVSEHWLQVLGYEQSEVIGRTVTDFMTEESRRYAEAVTIPEFIKTGYARDLSYQFVKKNGEIVDVLFSAIAERNAEGNFIQSLAVLKDVSEAKRAAERLCQSEQRFDLAVSGASDGLWDWDIPTGEEWWSPRFYELLGHEVGEIEATYAMFLDLLHPEDKDTTLEAVRAHLEDRVRYDVEIRLCTKSGEYRWFRSRGQALWDETGQPVRMAGSIQDITDHKRDEEALRQQAERLRVLRMMDQAILAARSPAAIAQAALRHIRRLVPCNRASILMFDFETQMCKVLAADVSDESRVRAGAQFPLEAVAEIEEIRQGKVRIFDDALLPSKLGGAIQVLNGEGLRSHLVVPLLSQHELIGSVNLGAERPSAFAPEHVDIVAEVANSVAVAIQNARLFEQVRAGSERLQNLSRQLVEVQEAERRHIARELHDEIGQALTGLKLTLEMNTRLPADAIGESLVEATAVVHDIMGKVRELSLSLRPPMLDDFGLLHALLWIFQRYTARTNVQVMTSNLTGLDGRRFPSEIETAAYRIVQEALTNIARHAHVPEATVSVWTDHTTLYVQIQDHGIGFDPEAVQASRPCSGLAGMRERVALLNGCFTLESAPGAGTQLTAELPLGVSVDGGTERG